jgi:hypothetical protein
MSKFPSGFQVMYTEHLASELATDLFISAKQQQHISRQYVTGNQGNSQLPPVPDSMLNEWAGTAAENLRKQILNYYREIGEFPE